MLVGIGNYYLKIKEIGTTYTNETLCTLGQSNFAEYCLPFEIQIGKCTYIDNIGLLLGFQFPFLFSSPTTKNDCADTFVVCMYPSRYANSATTEGASVRQWC